VRDLFINDQRAAGQNLRDFDTFHFHPIMIFANEFLNGFYLSVIYSNDWVIKATTTYPSATYDDESVKFFFNYALP
jgi:hypothetical protein